MAISRVGFGCARLFAGSELRASARLLEAAMSAGIRHFDTAPSYGGGTSEKVLGEFFGGQDDVTITTKVGIARPSVSTPTLSARVYRRVGRPVLTYLPGAKRLLLKLAASRRNRSQTQESATQKRVLRRDEILRSLEVSLRNLKRTQVDLFLIHEPDQFVLDEELFGVFEDLKSDGVIGAFGLGYGGIVEESIWPGAVIQGQLKPGLTKCFEDVTMIFHGLIRHARHNEEEGQPEQTPGRRLGDVLQQFPDCAVLFSASSARQINHIASDLLHFY